MRVVLVFAILIGSAQVLAQTRSYDTLPNLPAHYEERIALFKTEPIVKGGVIMLGNSITEGGNWKTILKDTTVVNRGIGGDVTFGILNRIKDVTDRKPAKVFLLIGINDLSRNTPDEVIVENIFNIVSRIRSGSPKTVVYVQSILPLNETFKSFSKRYLGKGEHITAINSELKQYAAKLRYTFIDLYSAFADSDGVLNAKLSSDGLHLNAAGYNVWVEILKKEKYL